MDASKYINEERRENRGLQFSMCTGTWSCLLTLLKIVSINSGLLVSVFSMTDVKIDFGDEGNPIFHVRSAAKNQTEKH